jgi:hypothetical protein
LNGRLALLLIALGGATCATVAATATGAASQRVTLTVERFFDPACAPLPGHAPSTARGGCPKLRFSGTISSGAPNEYVAVLSQQCGSSGVGSSLVGAQTRDGGSWQAEWWVGSGTFRARWKTATSAPVTFRDAVPLTLDKLSAFRHRVSVGGDQEMKGRIVELQRLVSGQWRLLRRVRLVADRSSYDANASATFTVRKRGLTLRAFVPAKSASPCYVATASETWTSGVAPGTASGAGARVIDRTFLCTTASQGGIRMISVRAWNGSGGAAGQGPSFDVSTGHSGSLASASANTGLYLYPDECRETRARVPLATRNLKARPPGPYGREFECEVPPRVVLRVRTVFREPTTLESSRSSGYRAQVLSAKGEMSDAAIAVRTPSGKALAYASLSSGKAGLHAARSCVEDT